MIWRTHLCKVFADVLSSIAQVMTERTGIASLASTLTKELARNVSGIYSEASCVSKGQDEDGRFGRHDMAGEDDRVVCNNMQPSITSHHITYSEGFGVHRSGEQ
jgi:hypothetical protein